jgi:hypothetical protein
LKPTSEFGVILGENKTASGEVTNAVRDFLSKSTIITENVSS